MAGHTSEERRRVNPEESLLELLDPRPLATRHKVGLGALVLFAVWPFFLNQITIRRLTVALYIGMFAMSWDVVSGYTGEISFGHSFFFAIGGYTSAVLTMTLGWHPVLTIVIAVVLAMIGGVLIGVPALRVSGPYLSLITLIAPLLLFQLFIIFSKTFGGETGLGNPVQLISPREEALLTVTSTVDALNWGVTDVVRVLNFYLAFVLFVVVLAILYIVTRSNAGVVFYAIRSGEEVVSATGKNPAKFKIFVFVLSAAVGGLAGAVFVHSNVGAATPSQLLVLEVSLLVIIAAVIGGMGTVVGAALGGIVIHLLEVAVLDSIDEEFYGIGTQWLNDLIGYQIAEMSFMLLGVIAIVMVFVAPGGLLRFAIEKGDAVRGRLRNRGGDT